MNADLKRYNKMENVLQHINSEIISLPEAEVKRNNEILSEILKLVTSKMKEIDILFKTMYQNLFYGGSFYDGLRIMHPDEFDIHMLFKLPPTIKKSIEISNIPGFIHVKFLQYDPSAETNYVKPSARYNNQRENGNINGFQRNNNMEIPNNYYRKPKPKFRGFHKFVNKNHYMDSNKIRQWMEQLFSKALNQFNRKNGNYMLKTSHGEFSVVVRKTGPAFTMNVQKGDIKIDVDLVPCFIFDKSHWPRSPFRENPVQSEKPDFYIVPKKPKGYDFDTDHYWLLNFQDQERNLINGKGNLKPAIKLMKKLNDKYNDKIIASYYIKTLGLWVLEENKRDPNYWKNSLSYTFMIVLKKYQAYLEKKNIPYYWNKNYNFIRNAKPVTIDNIYNKVTRMIKDIEKNVDLDPYVVAKYLVTEDQEKSLKARYPIP